MLEASIRKLWNGTEVPCLFDETIAFSPPLSSLPIVLEEMIQANEVSREDLTFGRFKMVVFPVDGFLNQRGILELTEYFLNHSKMPTDLLAGPPFPFKAIGVTLANAAAPYQQMRLSQQEGNNKRALVILFDTRDDPRTKQSFKEAFE